MKLPMASKVLLYSGATALALSASAAPYLFPDHPSIEGLMKYIAGIVVGVAIGAENIVPANGQHIEGGK